MAKKIGMEVSIAVAEAVGLCDVDVVSAYPITPQTHIVEHLSEIVAEGRLDAEFIPVESEHTALSACVGASAAGARTYTSTSSQGLALMHEIVFIAAALRLPIVMTVVNRALSGPINIWNDHGDVMSERDTGWIQYFVENGQEAIDHTFIAFRVGESKSVQLPVMINMDGFIVSHMIEPVIIPEKADVDKFLPKYNPVHKLDINNPITMGPVGIPEIYTEAKWAQNVALENSRRVIEQAWEEFGNIFGRYYKAIETYKADDADYLFITMGAISETAMTYIDQARQRGEKIGLVKIRLWRPFPSDAFINSIKNAKGLIIVDRAMTPGGFSNPVASELKSLLYNQKNKPLTSEFVTGLGGRDTTIKDFEKMHLSSIEQFNKGLNSTYKLVQVRGE